MRRLAPVFSLFFIAPFVAEFLLGDMPIVLLPALLALAPLYGGGALLIREVTRRTGRGWPTMLVLALAFAVIEEGLLTESLFNPNYVGQHLLAYLYIPFLGIGGLWTPYVLGVHVLGSIATPVALVEEATGARRTEPWLGKLGLWVVAGLFVVGNVVFFAISYNMSDGFLASPAQLISSAVIAAALAGVAFALPKRPEAKAVALSQRPEAGAVALPQRPEVVGAGEPREGSVPRPWVVFAAGVLAGVLFEGITFLPWYSGLFAGPLSLAVLAVLVSRWAKRAEWGPSHRFALIGAGLLTYAWHAFLMNGDTKADLIVGMASHVIFGVVGAVLAYRVYRRIHTPVVTAA